MGCAPKLNTKEMTMPHEDKLLHDERLRLEALAQAIQSAAFAGRVTSSTEIIVRASEFEAFIRSGKNLAATSSKN